MNNLAAAININNNDQQPERCWHPDPSFQPLFQQKKIQRVQAVGSDINTVLQAYAHCPVRDCDIVAIDLLYNSSLDAAFGARLDLLEAQHNNPAFAPKWNQEPNAQWREKIMKMFNQLCAPYTDPDFPNVHLLPAWHGCSLEVLNYILEGGYEALATKDAGFFGVARYFTPDAEYAHRVYASEGGGVLVMNWVSCGSAYPVVGGDMPQVPSYPTRQSNGDIADPIAKPQPNGDMVHLFAKPHYQNYDVHFAPVVPHPLDPSRAWCYPVKPNELPVYTELAVFQSAQVLPRYVVELRRRSIPLSLAPPQVYAAMLGFVGPGSTSTTVKAYVAALQNQAAFQSLSDAASQEKQRRQIENEQVEIKNILQGHVLKINEFQKIKKIGKGGFGTVFEGVWNQGQHHVAVKELKIKNDDARLKHQFMREAGLMFDLHHPNIVQIFGVIENPVSIVMELMAIGHLKGVLQRNTNLDWAWKWRWSLDIALGLQYLHSKGILHRDLKCENVFLDGNLVAKLGDFGLATSKSDSQITIGFQSNSVVGTTSWMAPELLDVYDAMASDGVRYSRYTDIYAFGMVLYEILTHNVPWEIELQGRPHNQLKLVAMNGVKNRRRPNMIGIDGPKDFVQLIGNCCVQDAGDRQRLDVSIATIRKYVGDPPQSAEAMHEKKKLAETLILQIHVPPAAAQKVSCDLEIITTQAPGAIDVVKLLQMQAPRGLCRVSNDVIAVVEFDDGGNGSGRVSFVSLLTKSIIASVGQDILKNPMGLCLNHQSHFIVTDNTLHQIFVIDKSGHLMKSSNPSVLKLNHPSAICFDDMHYRTVVADADSHRVLILNEDLSTVVETIGKPGSNEGEFAGPSGVGIDSKRRIIVADSGNHRIQVFEEEDNASTARGKKYRFSFTFGKKGTGHGEFDYCSQLTIDSQDRIIVCDFGNNRVQVFNCDGTFIGCTPDLRFGGIGVCLDGKGRIVCSTADNSIHTVRQKE